MDGIDDNASVAVLVPRAQRGEGFRSAPRVSSSRSEDHAEDD